jgi:hypothetical protein
MRIILAFSAGRKTSLKLDKERGRGEDNKTIQVTKKGKGKGNFYLFLKLSSASPDYTYISRTNYVNNFKNSKSW